MKYMLMTTSENITTGYGIVAKNLMKGLLKKGIDIKQLGLQNLGHQSKESQLPVLDGIYGNDALEFYTKLYGIDSLTTIIDNWLPQYEWLPNYIKRLKLNHICHVTIHSEPLPPILHNSIRNANFWVAPSKFVEKVLLKAGYDPKRVRYIPHGVDTKIFKPLPEEEKQKYRELMGYENKFVWIAVATNTGFEKNWQGLFYAYKVFLTQNPDAAKDTVLHCHTSPHYEGGASYDLEALGGMFGIADNLRFVAGMNLNAGTPPEEMARFYNISDCYISSTMGECLHPNSHVVADFNYKKMSEVKVGNSVLTREGWKKVKKLFRREYNGELVCITPYNLNDTLKLTPEHEVLAIKRNDERFENIKLNPEWIQSKDLEKGDLLLIPRKISNNKQKEYIDLLDYLDGDYIEENGLIYSVGRNQYGFKFKHSSKPIPRYIKVNKDLIDFIAWYLSEGCGFLKGKEGSLTISNNSKEVIDEVIEIGKRVFGLDSHFRICKKEDYDDTLNAVFNSKLLTRIIVNMCGRYSGHKKLPSWFMDLDEDLIIEFFKTYIKGDGNIYYNKPSNNPTASITTTSKELFNQMKLLMFKCGILPSCKIRDFDNKKWNRAYTLDLDGNNYDKLYGEHEKKKSMRIHLVDDNYIYVLIRKMDKEKYDGYVHDLEVEGEHNYTSSCLVHNSFHLPALESMACGIPCIIPNHTTGPQLVGEPKTGLLAEPLKMKNGQEFGWTGPNISDKWIIDPVDMADKMSEMYRDKKLREKFSKNAVKFAKKFDWETKIIPLWVEFLKYTEDFVESIDYKNKKLGI